MGLVDLSPLDAQLMFWTWAERIVYGIGVALLVALVGGPILIDRYERYRERKRTHLTGE